MKKRIISAIVMAIVLIPALIMGGIYFTILSGILALGGLYELINIRENKKKFPKLTKIFAYIIVLISTIITYNQNVFSYTLNYHLISIIIFVFLLPILFDDQEKPYNITDALYLIGSILFINIAFNLILVIRNYNLSYLIYLVLITITTDTFAFITGKYIGKNKLAPKVSPNKTIEGFVGGLIMGTFVPVVFYTCVINNNLSLVVLIFITMFLSFVGQLGDLVFSSIKRTFKVKDFSNLIPGHGGILDRFDSLIFVVLAFILVLGLI